MKFIRAADYCRMAWKNGGGSTTEVAIAPTTATLDDFDWRVSMANIATPGPFSRFPSVDRTLAVISGAGVHLTVDGATVTLDLSSHPYLFRGDADTSATLIDGPIVDLNVMSHGARYRHRMTRHHVGARLVVPKDAETVLLMPFGGDIEIDTLNAAIINGDAAIFDQDALAAISEVTPRGIGLADADIYLIAFWRR